MCDFAAIDTGPTRKQNAPGLQKNIAVWENEAVRLAAEYFRTDREIHRFAFERHMGGVLMQLRRAKA